MHDFRSLRNARLQVDVEAILPFAERERLGCGRYGEQDRLHDDLLRFQREAREQPDCVVGVEVMFALPELQHIYFEGGMKDRRLPIRPANQLHGNPLNHALSVARVDERKGEYHRELRMYRPGLYENDLRSENCGRELEQLVLEGRKDCYGKRGYRQAEWQPQSSAITSPNNEGSDERRSDDTGDGKEKSVRESHWRTTLASARAALYFKLN